MMFKVPQGIAPALLAFTFAFVSQAALAGPNQLAREGHRLAVKRCSACHATEKTGSSPHFLAPPFRSLAYGYPVDELDKLLIEGLPVGHPDMPSGPWKPADIKRFMAYLNYIGPKPVGSH
ncbi:MAG: cytochrome c [Rhizobiaceae bacterium]|nr:MAG: cytochrome c [Rhizobiaceae bacterium]